jgi:hypothetical protein
MRSLLDEGLGTFVIDAGGALEGMGAPHPFIHAPENRITPGTAEGDDVLQG